MPTASYIPEAIRQYTGRAGRDALASLAIAPANQSGTAPEGRKVRIGAKRIAGRSKLIEPGYSCVWFRLIHQEPSPR